MSTPLRAQTPSAGQEHPPDSPSASQTASAGTGHNAMDLFVILSQRSIFYPDIATTAGPLSTEEKFKLFIGNSIAPHTLLSSALGSAISQARDRPEGYGQGWEGYSKRFGSSMARHASSNFFGNFVLASALHQDPRFFPQKNPTFMSSVKYAMKRVVITRSDDGRNVPNWSGLSGQLMSEGLANAYWPDSDRGVSQTLSRFGFDLVYSAGGYLIRDYWPVIFKKLARSDASYH